MIVGILPVAYHLLGLLNMGGGGKGNELELHLTFESIKKIL